MQNQDLIDRPYFGYGTLLGESHMRSRYPSAQRLGTATYSDHELGFWRYSDGVEGGGCTIVDRPGSSMIGVLYRLDEDDTNKLLAVDGYDDEYEVRRIEVTDEAGDPVLAYTLRVHPDNGTWPPPDDYANLVTNGAEEAGLPAEYTNGLRQIIETARRTS